MEQITELALDISMSTGWAIGSPDMVRPTSGVYRTYAWKGNQEQRVLEFYNWLEAKHAEHRLTGICYEYTFIDAKRFDPDFIECQKSYVAMVWLFCAQRGLRVAHCPIGTWRKQFLGAADRAAVRDLKGKEFRAERRDMNKGAAMKACALRGWMVADDNEAEACGILNARLSQLDRLYAQRSLPHARRVELRAQRERYIGT